MRQLAQDFGCYLLEVARRKYGGNYSWHPCEQPVLVVGEPAFHVAIMSWDKLIGRLSGDRADDLVFFYQGFAERVQRAKPGDRIVYV